MKVALAVDNERPVSYVACDLSAGGALLVQGPALSVGRDARVMFALLGRDLVLRGRVIRTESDAEGRPCIGLCFRGVPTFVQDLIQSQVERARARLGSPDKPAGDARA